MLNLPEEQPVLDMLKNFVSDKEGYHNTYAMAVRTERGLEFQPRNSRPCYGELRRYVRGPDSGVWHGGIPLEGIDVKGKATKSREDGKNCTRPKDPWPGDLPMQVPVGVREALAVPMAFAVVAQKDPHTAIKIQASNLIAEYLFGDKSPWRKGWNNHEFITRADGLIVGAVMIDTRVDPTVLANLLQNSRSLYKAIGFILRGMSVAQAVYSCLSDSSYTFTTRLNLKAYITGEPRELSKGTWQDQDDYNRPEIQDLFLEKGDEFFSGTDYSLKLVEATPRPAYGGYKIRWNDPDSEKIGGHAEITQEQADTKLKELITEWDEAVTKALAA